MPIKSIVAAAVVAALGALLWAGVMVFVGLEIGWVAWILGAAVGGTAAWAGSRGTTAGVICAVLALAAILAGKWFGIHHTLHGEVEARFLPREVYEEHMEDAARLAAIDDPDRHAAFMVERDYSDARTASGVTASELARFRQEQLPRLRRMLDEKWTYERWIDEWIDDGIVTQAAIAELGIVDLIFGVLGLATAYRLGSRGRKPDEFAWPEIPKSTGTAPPTA